MLPLLQIGLPFPTFCRGKEKGPINSFSERLVSCPEIHPQPRPTHLAISRASIVQEVGNGHGRDRPSRRGAGPQHTGTGHNNPGGTRRWLERYHRRRGGESGIFRVLREGEIRRDRPVPRPRLCAHLPAGRPDRGWEGRLSAPACRHATADRCDLPTAPAGQAGAQAGQRAGHRTTRGAGHGAGDDAWARCVGGIPGDRSTRPPGNHRKEPGGVERRLSKAPPGVNGKCPTSTGRR